MRFPRIRVREDGFDQLGEYQGGSRLAIGGRVLGGRYYSDPSTCCWGGGHARGANAARAPRTLGDGDDRQPPPAPFSWCPPLPPPKEGAGHPSRRVLPYVRAIWNTSRQAGPGPGEAGGRGRGRRGGEEDAPSNTSNAQTQIGDLVSVSIWMQRLKERHKDCEAKKMEGWRKQR